MLRWRTCLLAKGRLESSRCRSPAYPMDHICAAHICPELAGVILAGQQPPAMLFGTCPLGQQVLSFASWPAGQALGAPPEGVVGVPGAGAGGGGGAPAEGAVAFLEPVSRVAPPRKAWWAFLEPVSRVVPPRKARWAFLEPVSRVAPRRRRGGRSWSRCRGWRTGSGHGGSCARSRRGW